MLNSTHQPNKKKTHSLIGNKFFLSSTFSLLSATAVISFSIIYKSRINNKAAYISLITLSSLTILINGVMILATIIGSSEKLLNSKKNPRSPNEIEPEESPEVDPNIHQPDRSDSIDSWSLGSSKQFKADDDDVVTEEEIDLDEVQERQRTHPVTVNTDKKSEEVSINYQDRLQGEEIDQILKHLNKRKKSDSDDTHIFVCKTIELLEGNVISDVLTPEYQKVKYISEEIAKEKQKGIVVIPVIYGAVGTASSEMQNTAAHTDMMVIDNTTDATSLTYIATADWLSEKIENRYKVQDISGKTHDLNQDTFDTLRESEEDEVKLWLCNEKNGVPVETLFNQTAKERNNITQYKKTADAQYTLETAKEEIRKRVNFFSSLDGERTVDPFTPLYNIKLEDIKVIQPCISWDHYTCGHAAIEGLLRFLFRDDKSIQHADETDNHDEIINRLEKLKNGEVEDVMMEIRELETSEQIDEVGSVTHLDQTQQNSL